MTHPANPCTPKRSKSQIQIIFLVLNCCSSVGEVADAAQNIGRYTGIPIVRIDEEMCREAVRLGKRVGVLATLPTTLEPTKNTVSRVAREMNSHVELVDGLVDAFGADQNKFKALLCAKAEEIADQVDCLTLLVLRTLFSHGSASPAQLSGHCA